MAGNAVLYDEDFYAWSMEQARLLRAGEFARLDGENLAEELESMGRRDKREVESRLVVLLAHLQPAVDQLLADAFTEARRRAAAETGLAETTFPIDCPFTGEQILAEDFLPEG
jgi:hypothetical protein